MGRLEERLRKLEELLVHQPTAGEYLEARNREGVRSLHRIAERLAPYGFNGDYLFTKYTLRMLDEDTLERQERDRETIEVWYRAQGWDRAAEVAGAKEKLLARLTVHSAT
jgi:hypothetical protein